MKITYCRDYESMSLLASSLVISEIKKKKDLMLCAATGGSPVGLYNKLANKAKEDSKLFEHLRVIKLDEWGGVPENHPMTCEYYLKTKLLDQLGIPSDRYISFDSDPETPFEECKRIQSELEQKGPIDVCILGLGKNGHIGFNEPDQNLEPFCHVADLSEESLQHDMVSLVNTKPRFGLTLGIQDILLSKKIILLVSGNNKVKIIEKLLSAKISTELPVSLLWLHGNIDCLVDQNSLGVMNSPTQT